MNHCGVILAHQAPDPSNTPGNWISYSAMAQAEAPKERLQMLCLTMSLRVGGSHRYPSAPALDLRLPLLAVVATSRSLHCPSRIFRGWSLGKLEH